MLSVEHLNPASMHHNSAFTQAIAVRGAHTTLYIGGQTAADGAGSIVGRGDIGAQAEQVAANLKTVLAAAGAGPQHIVRLGIHIVQGQPLMPAMIGFQKVFGHEAKPPTMTVVQVAGLAHPDFLLEVDGIAILPASDEA